jgi:hypothetical protein
MVRILAGHRPIFESQTGLSPTTGADDQVLISHTLLIVLVSVTATIVLIAIILSVKKSEAENFRQKTRLVTKQN